MFEDRTGENILQEMLDSITANVDKRQGAIIYDALAPKAFMVAKLYQDLSGVIDNVIFIDTANEDTLEKKGHEFGVDRKPASAAIRSATFTGASIGDGERFFTEDGVYWEYGLADNHLTCEDVGVVGNGTVIGSNLIPVENIQGLTSAVIGGVVIPGAEKEDLEEYRQRVLLKLREPEVNSNKAQIKAFCNSISSVGAARIFSLWNGANTVKGVIINTEKQPASASIVKQVQDYIDPSSQGLGEGVADIGVIFTAASATGTAINVSFQVISLASGKSIDDVKSEATQKITEYLKGIAFKSDTTKDIVRYQEISSTILGLESVIDFQGLTLNGAASNIEISLENVAILGTVTVTQ